MDAGANAMVLCAGLGTRLRPLTDELPKPLVPVGDRTLLAHACDRLAAAGFDRVIINTHHLPDAFERHLEGLPVEVEVVHEPEIRGTAGGVAGARHRLGAGPIVVWNGDILATPPLAKLCDAARETGVALAVAPRPVAEGTVGVDAVGGVTRMRGEVFGTEVRGGDYVGVLALDASAVSTLPEKGCLVGDLCLPRLRRGEPVVAVECSGDFTDAGDVERYVKSNLDWLDTKGEIAWVGSGAKVGAGVELERSLVGSGARVVGRGSLRRCVVWPGAVATAPLTGAVVLTSGRIVTVPSAGSGSR